MKQTFPDWKRVHVSDEIEQWAAMVVDSIFNVHVALGPGLLESAYEACLSRELELRGLRHSRQGPVPLEYKGSGVEVGYRADILVEEKLLIELKATDTVLPVHIAQVITYLRLKKYPLGILVNFNEILIKNGIHRILNVPRSPDRTLN